MSNNNPSADAGDINSSSHPTLQVEEIAPNQTDSSFTAYLKLFGVFITLLSLYIVYRFFRKTRSQVTSHDEYIRLPQGEGDIELGHQTKKLTVIHGDDDDDDPSSWEEWGAPKPKFSPVSSIHSVQHISPIKSMNSENPKSGLDLRPASKPSSPQILSPSTSDSVLKHYSLPHSDNNNNSSNSYDSLPLSLNASSINQQSSFNSINAESGIQSKQVKTKKTAAINDLNDVDLFATIGITAKPKFVPPIAAPSIPITSSVGRISSSKVNSLDTEGSGITTGSDWNKAEDELDDELFDD